MAKRSTSNLSRPFRMGVAQHAATTPQRAACAPREVLGNNALRVTAGKLAAAAPEMGWRRRGDCGSTWPPPCEFVQSGYLRWLWQWWVVAMETKSNEEGILTWRTAGARGTSGPGGVPAAAVVSDTRSHGLASYQTHTDPGQRR